ncbi:uncharacterized protein LOC111707306 [Eurytemora carolleeae]|uniref:uncharacterized protein LOC111707306 n=1 Tax=Eurytemora carolleeae TaxID=1294199 RepID=UPI000C76414B|nr:uncharacterized protein LOC111707306 [Eurytemora carolleeae]|eukprot:XP_023336158.1 uncharacterized protein LOC111707306 [Eurytemora affinis]
MNYSLVYLLLNLIFLQTKSQTINLSLQESRSYIGIPSVHPAHLEYLTRPNLHMLHSAGCHTTELQLSCDSGLLVIEGAIFRSTGTQTLLNCSGIEQHSRQDGSRFHLLQGDLDIHRELNRRCSGFSAATDCRFNLLLDSLASKAWGPGIVEVWHRCVPNKLIQKKCGTEVSGRGFLMSNSYPKYYMGGQVCSWKVESSRNQLVLIKVLDLHLEETGSGCGDVLTLGGRVSLCGELEAKIIYASESPVYITLNTSSNTQYIFPRRGFLLEYITLSCTPPRLFPTYSLIYSNQTHATYQCTLGWVFKDSSMSTATVLCSQGEIQVPQDCIPVGGAPDGASTPAVGLSIQPGDSFDAGLWFHEVLLPLVLLTFLLILSLAGLILLTLARRHRIEMDRVTEQQQNTFTVTTLDTYTHFQ